MGQQNTSSAVMQQRHEPTDSADFFPTPPWATRALFKFISPKLMDSCWEPACGAGHMSKVLEEQFMTVFSTDLHDYGYGEPGFDFLSPLSHTPEWIITNPPFNKAEEFAVTALHRATISVALLVRSSFLEGVGRYQRLFTPHPPTAVIQFTERVPMLKGRLEKNASTASSYAWIVWEKKDTSKVTEFLWTGVCRKSLERDYDYV